MTNASPTLAQISTNDFINYKGVTYAVASVVSITSHVGGTITAVITITVNANPVQLTLDTNDTILSSYNTDANGVVHATWSQTENA